jgi:DNA-binding NarL/FixJ family response regulator
MAASETAAARVILFMPPDQSTKRRILIVDDHPLFREGLQQLIDRTSDFEVCGEAADGAEAMTLIPQLQPDLALVDISLGTGSGIELIKTIKGRYEDLPVLVISMHNESIYAERALRAGAMGYVMKHERGKVVLHAIAQVLRGDIFVSDKMTTSILSKLTLGRDEKPLSPVETLSDRELEVLGMLGQVKETRQIAGELNLSVATINTFRARIKEKLKLKSPTELAMYAIQWYRESGGK